MSSQDLVFARMTRGMHGKPSNSMQQACGKKGFQNFPKHDKPQSVLVYRLGKFASDAGLPQLLQLLLCSGNLRTSRGHVASCKTEL